MLAFPVKAELAVKSATVVLFKRAIEAIELQNAPSMQGKDSKTPCLPYSFH